MSAEVEANVTLPQPAPEPSSFRLIATLGLAGLLAGLLLVGVYLVTLPLIQKNRAEAIQRAVFSVLPGTEHVEVYLRDGDRVTPWEGQAGAPPPGEVVYGGVAGDGRLVGYAIPAEGPGFMDTIGLIYGYDPVQHLVIGLEILESRETPGLGDKIAFDPAFVGSFLALELVPEIVGVKDGRNAPNEVDLISGATISAQAVIRIINVSSSRWAPVLSAAAETSDGDGDGDGDGEGEAEGAVEASP
jgi:Na+-translocating ferredoxin:NAD+ oxidoreductase subunit G